MVDSHYWHCYVEGSEGWTKKLVCCVARFAIRSMEYLGDHTNCIFTTVFERKNELERSIFLGKEREKKQQVITNAFLTYVIPARPEPRKHRRARWIINDNKIVIFSTLAK